MMRSQKTTGSTLTSAILTTQTADEQVANLVLSGDQQQAIRSAQEVAPARERGGNSSGNITPHFRKVCRPAAVGRRVQCSA